MADFQSLRHWLWRHSALLRRLQLSARLTVSVRMLENSMAQQGVAQSFGS